MEYNPAPWRKRENLNRYAVAVNVPVFVGGKEVVADRASEAGLVLGASGGIQVNEQMRTSRADIYACGDCVESWDRIRKCPSLNLLWKAAAEQGAAAGYNAAADYREEPKEFAGSASVFLTYIGEKPVVSFGKTEADLSGTPCRILERESDSSYMRILLQEERIAGVQMVGTMENSGLLLAALLKEEPVEWELPKEGTGRLAQAPAYLASWLTEEFRSFA